VADIENKRKELFAKAKAGDERARRELNKLNYDEQIRLQNTRK
jgi:hypothetical protein